MGDNDWSNKASALYHVDALLASACSAGNCCRMHATGQNNAAWFSMQLDAWFELIAGIVCTCCLDLIPLFLLFAKVLNRIQIVAVFGLFWSLLQCLVSVVPPLVYDVNFEGTRNSSWWMIHFSWLDNWLHVLHISCWMWRLVFGRDAVQHLYVLDHPTTDCNTVLVVGLGPVRLWW
jgi:hypothetical protein